jgi:hypothetical protein
MNSPVNANHALGEATVSPDFCEICNHTREECNCFDLTESDLWGDEKRDSGRGPREWDEQEAPGRRA